MHTLETQRCFVVLCLDTIHSWMFPCVGDRTCEPTFDFLFLFSASYFHSDTSDADDRLQLGQGEERGRLQLPYSSQEVRGLGCIREAGRRRMGAMPVVHLEEKEQARKQERERIILI